MTILELAARRHGIGHVLLTVMHANDAAQKLYRSLGYAADVTTPEPETGAGYDILSKRVAAAAGPAGKRVENQAMAANQA